MPNDRTLILGASQSYELQQAMRRVLDWTAYDTKALCDPGFLKLVRDAIRGTATIQTLPPEERAPVAQFYRNDFRFTIRLGERKNSDEYLEALEKSGFRTNDEAAQILPKVTIAEPGTESTLIVVKVIDLGFTEAVPLDELYAKAQLMGLRLCPSEVGPALRLAYEDQPDNEWLRIAMDPLTDSSGNLKVFGVCGGPSWRTLGSFSGNPDVCRNPADTWVFALPGK